MATNDDAPPSVYFGDYPNVASWWAEPSRGAQTDEFAGYSISGSGIGLVWDCGVRILLRDAEGLLPKEPDRLREALGLSVWVIDDFSRWGLDMVVPVICRRRSAAHGRPRGRGTSVIAFRMGSLWQESGRRDRSGAG